MKNIQYPLFITVAEAAALLRLGRTSIYRLIKEEYLVVAKFGRSTRITFSSIISYSLRKVESGSKTEAASEIFPADSVTSASAVAKQLAGLLCHTHCGHDERITDRQDCREERSNVRRKKKSLGKNFSGDIR